MSIAEKLADEIAATLKNNGPLTSLWEEWSSQAFQQAHAIRGLLACHRIKPKKVYLDTAMDWARMTLRLQGTQGHPDRYNMGYGEQTRNGVPRGWFVADCGTIAVALLDVASFLPEGKLRGEIIDSVKRFADYIKANWTLKDGSISLGYWHFEPQKKKAYHCANAQTNLFLWPLWKVTGEESYRHQAVKTTEWLATWKDYDSTHHGGSIHNRAYNGESLFVSLAHVDKNGKLYHKIAVNIKNHIIKWLLENYETGWFNGGQPSHAKDPLLIENLLFYNKYFRPDSKVKAVVESAVRKTRNMLEKSFAAVRKHRVSGMALASNHEAAKRSTDLFEEILLPKFYTTDGLTAMAMAVHEQPDSLYPLNEK